MSDYLLAARMTLSSFGKGTLVTIAEDLNWIESLRMSNYLPAARMPLSAFGKDTLVTSAIGLSSEVPGK
jgi:hypothetical protein